jgi:hypothetical protein
MTRISAYPTSNKRPKESAHSDEESHKTKKVKIEEYESESEAELSSTKPQQTVERYQQLKKMVTDNPNETFRCLDLLRDRSSGDSNSVVLIPNSTITEVEEHFFHLCDKKGKISALTSARNPSLFDFFAWRIKYGSDAYELDDEWEQGQPRVIKNTFSVEINGKTINAMSPNDYGKWEDYELLIDELNNSLDFTITHRYFIEFDC